MEQHRPQVRVLALQRADDRVALADRGPAPPSSSSESVASACSQAPAGPATSPVTASPSWRSSTAAESAQPSTGNAMRIERGSSAGRTQPPKNSCCRAMS
ncbi:hypothetical protein ACQP2P_24835 [Dactylosporangium sp. CA-139114]|uniref:hypothetical protein n=1 Tax=Dactylosporangium sp. CA-139114 TaxID=3239931 RepID=UPI003D99F72E